MFFQISNFELKGVSDVAVHRTVLDKTVRWSVLLASVGSQYVRNLTWGGGILRLQKLEINYMHFTRCALSSHAWLELIKTERGEA